MEYTFHTDDNNTYYLKDQKGDTLPYHPLILNTHGTRMIAW